MISQDQLDQTKIPQHIAIIMDGNGRWAKLHGKARVYGHHKGVESVRSVVEACTELGVKYLTLYAFSTENWKRPEQEVIALMELLVRTIRKETPELNTKNVRIRTIGDGHSLPKTCIDELNEAKQLTEKNTGLNLILALSYSGRWEIANAAKEIAKQVQEKKLNVDAIDEKLFEQYLNTKDIPDPELLIRTSGEYRISNYLLWQSAYSEFYFTKTLWPDFDKQELINAIYDYQNRERRFGKISEQLEVK
ncbi:MAG: isoprenyl transferase [Fimbriimonadaceae bacterium]|nr:isoprenyl transferase [Chitinophagales bacterium]